MKVELQNGDRIAIPEGCKAVINDGMVVFEKEEHEFKDGDIVSVTDYWGDTDILILKYRDTKGFNYYYIALSGSSGNLVQKSSDEDYWGNITPVLATEEEKRILFDKMKKQGLRWNAEEKRVEKIRWRAKKGEAYCRIDLRGDVFCEIDRRTDVDNMFYDTLNHFRTEDQAREAAKRVKETLRKYHEEIGE